MSDTSTSLLRKISSAGELQSVVRTMKALAAASIGQYEKSVLALADYSRVVDLGLGLCSREVQAKQLASERKAKDDEASIGVIVFGSDQGLVGQFNEIIAEFTIKTLGTLAGNLEVWTVGERVQERLSDAGLTVVGNLAVPTSVNGIAHLVDRVQVESETQRGKGEYSRVYVFHNRPKVATLYEPVSQRLLPLDEQWMEGVSRIPWPNRSLPHVVGGELATFRSLVREYLFISLFKACAESLASENASRLAAMDRADRNISDLQESLQSKFHRLRQSRIDEELFDVLAGFEALS